MSKTIAVIFDFDETLASDSSVGFTNSLGVDFDIFWRQELKSMLDDGWDPVPAYMHKIIKLAQTKKVNKQAFRKFGEQIKFFPGVVRLFANLREEVKKLNSQHGNQVELDFYLISSGIGEIIRHSKIAKEFKEIWSCEFEYDGKGVPLAPKKVISFTDKTRYIFQIGKGLVGEKYRKDPFAVNYRMDYQIPLNQMVYIGDGMTDVPCFSLMQKNGGVAYAVYSSSPEKAWQFTTSNRVNTVIEASYGTQGNSYKMIVAGIKNIYGKI